MADDPTADSGPSRDLLARIQQMQGDENGPSAGQVEDGVRSAVSDALTRTLPGLVEDAVTRAVARGSASSATTGPVPVVGATRPDEFIEPRLAALEDTLDAVGDQLEVIGREATESRTSSLAAMESLRTDLADVAEQVDGERVVESGRAEMEALRIDLANALEYVRETISTRFETDLTGLRDTVGAIADGVSRLRDRDAAGALERASADHAPDDGRLQAIVERLDELSSRPDAADSVAALHDRLDDLGGGPGSAAPAGSSPEVEALVAALGARLDSLDAAVADLPFSMAGPSEGGGGASAGGEAALASLHDRLDGLERSLAAGSAAPDDGVRASLDALHDRVGALADTAAAVPVDPTPTLTRADVQALLDDRLGDLTAAVTRLESRPEPAFPTMPEVPDTTPALQALQDRLDAVSNAVSAHGDSLGARLDEHLAATRSSFAELGSADTGPTPASAADQAAAISELVSASVTDAVVARVSDSVSGTVSEAVSAAVSTAVTGAVIEGVGAGLADTVADSVRTGSAEPLTILQADLAALRSRVESSDAGAEIRTEVDALRVDVADALDLVRRTVESRAGDTTDRVVAELLELRADLATSGAETITTLAAVRDEAAAGPDHTADLDAIRSGLAELHADLAASGVETSGSLAALRAVPAPDHGPELAAISAELLELRADLATSGAETLTTLSALRAAPAPDHTDTLAAIRSEVETLPRQLDVVRAEQEAQAARLEAVVEAASARVPAAPDLSGLVGLLDDLLGAQDATADRLSALGDIRGAQDEIAERLSGLDELLSGQAWLADRIGAMEESEQPDVLGALAPQIAGLHERLDSVDDGLRTVRDTSAQTARGAAGEQADRHAALTGRFAALDARLDDVAAGLDPLVDRVAEHSAAVGLLPAQVADGLAAGNADIAARHDRLRADLSDQLGAGLAGVSADVGAMRASAESERQRVLDTLDDLARARADLAVLADRVAAQVQSATDVLQGASLEALERVRADTERAVRDLRTEIAAARGALEDHAQALQADVGDEARRSAEEAFDGVRSAVTAQLAEVGSARSEIALVAERVRAAGRLLVGYLGERDLALEEIRDRTVVQLLADVLDGMPRKDRERAEDHARTLIGRRRDARQAERWRDERSGKIAAAFPAAGSYEELVEMLDAQAEADEPAPAGPVRGRGELPDAHPGTGPDTNPDTQTTGEIPALTAGAPTAASERVTVVPPSAASPAPAPVPAAVPAPAPAPSPARAATRPVPRPGLPATGSAVAAKRPRVPASRPATTRTAPSRATATDPADEPTSAGSRSTPARRSAPRKAALPQTPSPSGSPPASRSASARKAPQPATPRKVASRAATPARATPARATPARSAPARPTPAVKASGTGARKTVVRTGTATRGASRDAASRPVTPGSAASPTVEPTGRPTSR